MKMTYIRITILVYFLTDTLNWQLVWSKEKYLLNSLDEKLGFLKTNVKNLPVPRINK